MKVACLLGDRPEVEIKRSGGLTNRIIHLKAKMDEKGLREYYGQFLSGGSSLSHSVKYMEYWESLLSELNTTHKREVAIFA